MSRVDITVAAHPSHPAPGVTSCGRLTRNQGAKPTALFWRRRPKDAIRASWWSGTEFPWRMRDSRSYQDFSHQCSESGLPANGRAPSCWAQNPTRESTNSASPRTPFERSSRSGHSLHGDHRSCRKTCAFSGRTESLGSYRFRTSETHTWTSVSKKHLSYGEPFHS